MNQVMSQVLPWLGMLGVPIVLFVGGLLVMAVDAFSREGRDAAFLSLLVALLAFGMCVAGWVGVTGQGTVPDGVSDYLAVGSFSRALELVIAFGTVLGCLVGMDYLREYGLERGEYYVVLLFSAFGACVLARASNLITVFVGLETMSLGVYSLVGFRRTSPRSAEAAVKYFLLGSFASAVFLFGCAMLYGATGTLVLRDAGSAIAEGTATVSLVVLSVALLVGAFAFKVSAAPFHVWAPDAYEGAATSVTAFMAVVVKSAGFAALARLLVQCFSDDALAQGSGSWSAALGVLALLSLLVGNFSAVVQSSVKRMLAYSSISHAGVMLIGLATIPAVGERALSGVVFYLFAYAASTLLAFSCLIWSGSRGREVVDYEDLAGLGRRHPWLGLGYVVAMLSLMGFPPTAGFMGKYYVLAPAIGAGGMLFWLGLFGVFASVVSAYYYLRVLMFLYMRDQDDEARVAFPMRGTFTMFAVLLTGYLIVRMGVAPGQYLRMAVEAATGLL